MSLSPPIPYLKQNSQGSLECQEQMNPKPKGQNEGNMSLGGLRMEEEGDGVEAVVVGGGGRRGGRSGQNERGDDVNGLAVKGKRPGEEAVRPVADLHVFPWSSSLNERSFRCAATEVETCRYPTTNK